MDEIREEAKELLKISGEKLKSLAFVYFCVKTMLDLEHAEAFECLVEGGGDFAIDAVHVSEVIDDEFVVSLFQGKYKKNLKGDSNFEENAIKALIQALDYLFDPAMKITRANSLITTKMEAIRSLIRDGAFPRVRIFACNNGKKWNDSAQELIDSNIPRFGEQVSWEYVNHDTLVNIIKKTEKIEEKLHLTGKAIFEDMDFSRVCIGRIPVHEIAELMKRNKDKLLERNVRRYLGMNGNRVNIEIHKTLLSENPNNFYFFNNGLTLTCTGFTYNALQKENYIISVEDLQIVNGAQTSMTILKTLEEMPDEEKKKLNNTSVLFRLYQLPEATSDLVSQITKATNSQNPVDLKDLLSNDELQKNLAVSIGDLGYFYKTKRSDSSPKSDEITSGTAAEAVLSIWRDSPHQAKFRTKEHFGKLYKTIFTDDLNGSQVITAVLLYRIAETHRKRSDSRDPEFVRYGSCFIARQMGKHLLNDMGIKGHVNLDHSNFSEACALIEKKGSQYFKKAMADVKAALTRLYGSKRISMQQLSATFRRGDLIEILDAGAKGKTAKQKGKR